ncbi:MAG TPA: NosD domain-containing protein, partial [bacterium]|nr:NosD domain-containing protein [bacterium]
RAEENATRGMSLLNVTGSVLTGNRIVRTAGMGIVLQGSTDNTLTDNVLDSVASTGLYLISGADRIVLDSNTVINGGADAMYLMSDSCTLTNNLVAGNAGQGIVLSGADTAEVRGNRVAGGSTGLQVGGYAGRISGNRIIGAATGVTFTGGGSNLLLQNDIIGSTDSGIRMTTASTNNVLTRNNVEKYVTNTTAADFDLRGNWWGVTDSAVLAAQLKSTGGGLLYWQPYRFGAVDTAAGADTAAPAAPDSVTASPTTGGCTLAWTVTGLNEGIGTDATDTAGYRIYRSLGLFDTYAWIGNAPAAARSFVDSGLTSEDVRYYRVTAYDNHAGTPNESWYSDSAAAATPIYNGPVWYVSSDTGSDTVAGTGSALHPYRTIFKALTACVSGDTIRLYACANVFSESVVVTRDTVAIIGSGMGRTVIAPLASEDAIKVVGRSGIVVRDLTCTGSSGSMSGLYMKNVWHAELTRMEVINRNFGMLLDGCTGAVIHDCRIDSTYYYQIAFEGTGLQGNCIDSNTLLRGLNYGMSILSDSNTIRNNRITSATTRAIHLSGADTTLVSGNYVYNTRGTGVGLYIEGAGGNVIYNNLFDSNGVQIQINGAASIRNTIDSNTVRNGSSAGITLASDSNTLSNNAITGNAGNGISLANANFNALYGNTIRGNTNSGIYLNACYSVTIDTNVTDSNASAGMFLANLNCGRVRGNRISGNAGCGLMLNAS